MKQYGVAVKAVIVNKEDINPETYDLPGGRIEFGEKPEEALRREVKEETGLEVEILSVFNTWSFQKDEEFQLIGIDFFCKLLIGSEMLSDEHNEYAWMSLSEVEKSNLPGWLIKTIQKAEKIKDLRL